jgi:HEAT repeat protein
MAKTKVDMIKYRFFFISIPIVHVTLASFLNFGYSGPAHDQRTSPSQDEEKAPPRPWSRGDAVRGLSEKEHAVELERRKVKKEIELIVQAAFDREHVDTWSIISRLRQILRGSKVDDVPGKVMPLLPENRSTSQPDVSQLYYEALLDRLRSEKDPEKRRGCLACLATFFDDRGERALRQALAEDADVRVRQSAACSLGRYRTQTSVEALAEAFQRHRTGMPAAEPQIAYEALSSLGEIARPEGSLILRSIWRSPDIHEADRQKALIALASVGDLEDVPVFTSLLKEKDEDLRDAGIYAYERTASRYRENPQKTAPLRAVLRGFLKDPDPRTRCAVAREFAIFGHDDDLPFLQPLLQDPHESKISYSKGGVVMEKVIYDIREAAQESIRLITSRMESKKPSD